MARESLDEAVAAPLTVMLGDTEVVLYPLRLRQWGRIERWMRQEIITAATDAMRADKSLNEHQMRIIVGEAARSAQSISILNDDVQAGLMQSLGAMRQMIYWSLAQGNEALRNGQRELDPEKVDALVHNFDRVSSLAEQIMELSFPSRKDTAQPAGKPEAEGEKEGRAANP